MVLLGFDMGFGQSSSFWRFERRGLGFMFQIVFGLWLCLVLSQPVAGLRPLRERARSWGDEWLFIRKDESDLGPFSAWNITGTYRGSWKFLDSTNGSSRFPDLRKSAGNSMIELVSTPTKITGVHYVQGVIIFHDVFDNEHNVGGAQIRVEGVYIWPFRQLRMVANSGKEGELSQEDDYLLSNPYHLLGVFSSQVFQESPRDKIWRRKHSPIYQMEKHCNIEIAAQISRVSSNQNGVFSSQVFQESPRDKIWRRKHSPIYQMEKHCNIEIAAQISRVSSNQNDGDRDRYHMEGLMESPAVDDDRDCFSPLLINATSVNIEVYYNKAVNYTLMVTFVSFLQVLLLIRQMEHGNTQSGAAKVSILMIGQQAIMDAYLCLLHLTAGILVESLFNAFATAAFFKFVVFSIFEMRYLLAIWKASRPMNNGEGWETMRRELSVLYSRFYGILLGGILVMSWCICLCVFIVLQASILLLQHYLGSRWFIPRQILPEKYSYYRRFDQDTNHATDCVICMTSIDFTHRSNDCMVTPCDHFFHSEHLLCFYIILDQLTLPNSLILVGNRIAFHLEFTFRRKGSIITAKSNIRMRTVIKRT
nr:transmembrane e3 ubiquitin-protein ligase 1 [Quercus suber]